jgi:hypothetical protein
MFFLDALDRFKDVIMYHLKVECVALREWLTICRTVYMEPVPVPRKNECFNPVPFVELKLRGLALLLDTRSGTRWRCRVVAQITVMTIMSGHVIR